MSYGTTEEQRCLYRALLEAVERSASDPAGLLVVEEKVRHAPLDPDDRSDLIGRIGIYQADSERARASN